MKISFPILMLACWFGCCSYIHTLQNDKKYDHVNEIESLPKISYNGLIREIQPNVVVINRDTTYAIDSLLSVYLEDNIKIKCPNLCEGYFRYTMNLGINEKGRFEKVVISNKIEGHEIVENLIISTLKEMEVTPAMKNDKNISVNINVAVRVDLYNSISKIKQRLFY